VLLFVQTLLMILLCTTTPAPRQEGGAASAPPTRPPAHPIDRLRERWSGRPREERERLERHLAEFEGLPHEARQRMLERARAMRQRELSLEHELPAELPLRVHGPDAAAARQLLRERLSEHFRAHGRALRERLPADVRHRLELIPPEKRRHLLERLLGDRDRLSLLVLRQMRERHRLSALEAQRLEEMALPDRLKALRDLSLRTELGRG